MILLLLLLINSSFIITGKYVVVWQSEDVDPVVSGQIFEDDGSKVEQEFIVSTRTEQRLPKVTPLSDNRFLVVFYGGQEITLDNVYGVIYDGNGRTEIRPNINYLQSRQLYPDAANLSTGGWAYVYDSVGEDGSGDSIQAAVYTKNGDMIGQHFQINTDNTVGDQVRPSVIGIENGRFVVVWSDDINIKVRIINSDLSMEPIAQVNAVGNDIKNEENIAISFSPYNGDVCIAWENSFREINLKVFKTDTSTFYFSGDTPISSNEDPAYLPSIAPLPDGGWVVCFIQYNKVYCRLFNNIGGDDDLNNNYLLTDEHGPDQIHLSTNIALLETEQIVVTFDIFSQTETDRIIYSAIIINPTSNNPTISSLSRVNTIIDNPSLNPWVASINFNRNSNTPLDMMIVIITASSAVGLIVLLSIYFFRLRTKRRLQQRNFHFPESNTQQSTMYFDTNQNRRSSPMRGYGSPRPSHPTEFRSSSPTGYNTQRSDITVSSWGSQRSDITQSIVF